MTFVPPQEEREREEEYFDYLEKKENIEEKMASLKELRVNVVQCKTVSNQINEVFTYTCGQALGRTFINLLSYNIIAVSIAGQLHNFCILYLLYIIV